MRVVVTGGSGGVGGEVCRRLLQLRHEAIVVDRVAPESSGLPYFTADATRRGQVATAIKAVRHRHGALDALVNCIGVYDARTLDTFTWTAFDRSVQINVAACIEAVLAFVDCKDDGRGAVVTLSSAGARTASRDLAYATTKAAIEGASRSLAQSLAPSEVMVFCIAPGLVDTPMSRRMPVDRRTQHEERSILKRPGTAAEIADLVLYLLTGPTDLLTGTVIDASGGLLSL